MEQLFYAKCHYSCDTFEPVAWQGQKPPSTSALPQQWHKQSWSKEAVNRHSFYAELKGKTLLQDRTQFRHESWSKRKITKKIYPAYTVFQNKATQATFIFLASSKEPNNIIVNSFSWSQDLSTVIWCFKVRLFKQECVIFLMYFLSFLINKDLHWSVSHSYTIKILSRLRKGQSFSGHIHWH